jgi:signal transduction histidine kinase
MEQLVEDLLDVARSMADHLVLDYGDHDLRELTREVTERFCEEAARTGPVVEQLPKPIKAKDLLLVVAHCGTRTRRA